MNVPLDYHKFQLKEIITYWLNLKAANAEGAANWKELYKFTEYYNIPDLSPETLDQLAQSFAPGVDEE